MPAAFEIDVRRLGGEISPLWFGHNLEHTRSCVSEGLSAQLVRNRKFAGLPQRRGVARHWYGIGPRESWFLVEQPRGYKGTDGEPYTATFDGAPRPAGFRQRIECLRAGTPCGVGQRGIPLAAGRSYEGRVALRADRALRTRIALPGVLDTEAMVPPGDWQVAEFRFTAPETTDDARLEITFADRGVLWLGVVSLLPADHFHGLRRDVVELLRTVGVPLLRWPGGNFAGDYRWQDGLLPVDRRAPLSSPIYTQPHTDGFDTHEVGTDEFIALCRELGAEPFITINMSTQGAPEAAAWVEYCNGSPETTWGRRRAERGHIEPYNVTHWTLGNEMGYDHMAGASTAAEYARCAAECARAMRAVDPSLTLTASSAWHCEWYRDVLAAGGDDYQNISHHTYHGLMKSYEGEAARQEFRRLATAPDTAFHGTALIDGRQGDDPITLRDLRQLIDARKPARKPVGIAFDEWNVWYAWYRVPGVPEGVYAGSMLNLFCREARKVGMALGAYFEPVNEGAVLVEPHGARLTPVGHVMALFRPHHGSELVEVECPPYGDISLAASLAEGREQLTVTLVNRSPEAAREVAVLLRGATPRGAPKGVLLASHDFLPGSEFQKTPLEARAKHDGTWALALPPHSVARLSWSLVWEGQQASATQTRR